MQYQIRECVVLAGLLGALLLPAIKVAGAQQVDPLSSLSLDSLLNTRISTASKYDQTTAEAPASVTILTADDIQRFGYRTLQEVLENVRGFYVSNDRNYTFIGTRGFSRPTDYNNRVLLLMDGQRLNDHTWGGAPLGSDLPINFDAIERIEIVRGPGATLYGTNAMFAVINIVTRTVASLDGVIVGARVGSAGLREGTFAAGRSLGASSSFTVSGIISQLDGTDLYFPEYDAPETNSGIAQDSDWERAAGVLGALTRGNVTGRAGFRSRAKGIPTGAFGSRFNDPRAETLDETFWANVAVTRELAGHVDLTGRVSFDHYRYTGVYPGDAGPAYFDGGGSTSLAGEGTLVWEASSRLRSTVGVEHRQVLRADYHEQYPDGTRTEDDQPTSLASLFAQQEFQLSHLLTFVGGLRWDGTSRDQTALSPRLAILVTPSPTATFKALYGEAFRAPSPAEAYITTSYYTANPILRPERMRTLELIAELRLTSALLVGGSLFAYRIQDLIDQAETPAGDLEFRNLATANGAGLEVEIEYRPVGPLSARASYAHQDAMAAPLNERLTNSPEHIGIASLTAQGRDGIQVSALARYESSRRTIAGTLTRAFVRTDANVSWRPPTVTGAELGLRIVNLFDVRYQTPGGLEHLQDAITQDGRRLALHLAWRF